MNKRLASCILISALIFVVTIVVGYIYVQRANYYSALDATKEWSRLNDFPTTAKDFTVEAEGSMFTREFTIQFDAPLSDIEIWLNESPGTREVTPTINGNLRIYMIEPGGGAQHAELDLDENTGRVRINAYWS